MQNHEPKVGIALASYKPTAEILAEQLRSISDQTYKNWFCVITCDSPINEFSSHRELEKYFSDSRFVWIENQERLGVARNFEKAIAECVKLDPVYISCADQDDVWHPTKTAKLVDALSKLPQMSVVHCNMRILKLKEGRYEIVPGTAWELEKRGLQNVGPSDLIIRNIVAGAGMLFDAALARKFPTYPGDLFLHDHWFALIGALHGGVYSLNEPLYDYRIHLTNDSGLTVYQGLFRASKDVAQFGYLGKSKNVYRKTKRRYETIAALGFNLKPAQKIMFAFKGDLGIGFLIKAITNLKSDRAIARACIARAIGKLTSII